MIWNQMLGHRHLIERFGRQVAHDRLASTFLFVGPEGVGKRRFAEGLAETLLCQKRTPGTFAACGTCVSCLQVQAGTHPDVHRVEKPEDKNVLPIELFVGDREHRAQEGLCRDIRLKPTQGSRKLAIIDDADYLNAESANVLLKTLEEPPPRAVLILIGTSPYRQLPTILSRCQLVTFYPLSADEVLAILQQMPDLETRVPLEELAAASMGSVKLAKQLADPAIFDFRKDWLQQLATLDPGQDDFGSTLIKFAGAGAKEGAAKRENLYLIADQAIYFYRLLLSRLLGEPYEADTLLQQAVNQAAQHWKSPWGQIGLAIDRLCEFQQQIEANANAANAVDPLLADLRRIGLGRRPFGLLVQA